MNNQVILTSLTRVAILLAMFGVFGFSTIVLAQNEPAPTQLNVRNDFNGDQQADLVFASPTSNTWRIESLDGTANNVSIGQMGDRPAAADYDGDSVEDAAVVHNKDGQLIWNVHHSSTGKDVQISWGVDGDSLVQGDYDGDKMADPAVWRPGDGTWYILSSKSGEMLMQQWGEQTDKAMPGDYDGDGVMDVCVYRPGNNTFYYYTSTSDMIHAQVFGPFVMSGNEVFVLADYDGDSITDFAIFDASKNSAFIVRESATGKYRTTILHGNSPVCDPFVGCGDFDFAVPADYDHDGRVDPAIWDSRFSQVSAMGSSKGLMVFPTTTTEEMIPVSAFFMTK